MSTFGQRGGRILRILFLVALSVLFYTYRGSIYGSATMQFQALALVLASIAAGSFAFVPGREPLRLLTCASLFAGAACLSAVFATSPGRLLIWPLLTWNVAAPLGVVVALLSYGLPLAIARILALGAGCVGGIVLQIAAAALAPYWFETSIFAAALSVVAAIAVYRSVASEHHSTGVSLFLVAGCAVLIGHFSDAQWRVVPTLLVSTLAILAVLDGHPISAIAAVEAPVRKDIDSATRDPLTEVYNRRALDKRGPVYFSGSLDADRPISVLMLDIDHFKQVNDNYGHATGDVVLAQFANSISQHVRGTDFVARYGGEEFLIILPGAPLAPAMRLAERIREGVQHLEIQHQGRLIKITTSIGAASQFPGDGGTFRDLVDRADKNLYSAKRGGRNQVMADSLKSLMKDPDD